MERREKHFDVFLIYHISNRNCEPIRLLTWNAGKNIFSCRHFGTYSFCRSIRRSCQGTVVSFLTLLLTKSELPYSLHSLSKTFENIVSRIRTPKGFENITFVSLFLNRKLFI